MVQVAQVEQPRRARKIGFEAGMVEPGTAVQQDDGWNLAHPRAVRAQLGTLNVKEEAEFSPTLMRMALVLHLCFETGLIGMLHQNKM